MSESLRLPKIWQKFLLTTVLETFANLRIANIAVYSYGMGFQISKLTDIVPSAPMHPYIYSLKKKE